MAAIAARGCACRRGCAATDALFEVERLLEFISVVCGAIAGVGVVLALSPFWVGVTSSRREHGYCAAIHAFTTLVNAAFCFFTSASDVNSIVARSLPNHVSNASGSSTASRVFGAFDFAPR